MRTFARLFSIVALLSLGFVAQALPYEAKGGAVAARENGAPATFAGSDPSFSGVTPYDDDTPQNTRRAPDSMMLLTTLNNDVSVLCLKLKSSSNPEDAKAVIGLVISKLKACALAGLGATPIPDKAKAATVFLGILQAVVTACAAVSAKFGAGICVDLLAQVDAAIFSLLSNLDKCFDGFVPVVAGLCAKLDGTFAANLKALGFQLVAKALGLA
ncbi:hypothetical protein FRC06_010149 [Ceratobasidium sp. 370]|nr:hypothetical protein FRC06_010149 [Ceratobasidium sp. 370]